MLLVAAARWREADVTLLSAPERERAERMTAAARPAFVTARAALRRLLGACLDRDPGQVPLHQDGSGPVCLVPAAGEMGEGGEAGEAPGPFFSVAHSGSRLQSWIAVAVSRTVRVGVDLEVPTRPLDWRRLARRRYHPDDVARLERLARINPAAARQQFFALWTLKEAIVKLEQGSLMPYLAQVQIDLGGAAPTLTAPTPGGHRQLYLHSRRLSARCLSARRQPERPLQLGLAAHKPAAVTLIGEASVAGTHFHRDSSP